MKLFFFKKCS